MMIAIYFDLDGTLLNSARCSVVTTQQTFRKFFAEDIAEEKIIERMGIPIEISFRELSDNKINDNNWEEVSNYFRTMYKKNSDTHTSLFDGIEEFLEDIRAPSRNLFVVTSKKSEPAENNLASLKIRHFFQAVIGSDKVEHYKPHPDPIYKARRYLGEKPERELMIGDADTDIIMGKDAGVKTCAVTWGAHNKTRLAQANPDYMADNIKEMKRLILSLS